MAEGPYIATLDIETSGLNPSDSVILELAIVLTKHSAPTEYIDHRTWVLGCQQRDYDHADPLVQKMHTDNGLWAEALQAGLDGVWLHDVLPEIQAFLADPNLYTICGASVGNFDLAFLKHDVPHLAARFSHRVLDVTSVRMACLHAGGDPAIFKRSEAHRALDDCIETLENYQIALDFIRQGK